MSFLVKAYRSPQIFLVLFVCLNSLVLPKQLILKNDDFGYLDSVVRSLREGQLVVSDFLEPFAITLTFLSSLSYHLTQNLWLATYGLLLIIQIALWFVIFSLSREYFTRMHAAALTTGLLLFPLIFGKLHEFTSVPLYWTFFFAFILCWPKRPWLACLCFVLAFGCRQSAVTLLVLPFLSLFDGRKYLTPMLVIMVGLLACAFITLSLEPSFAQLNLTHKMGELFQWSVFLRSLCAFSLFAFAGAGIAHVLGSGFNIERPSLWFAGMIVLVSGAVLKPWNSWLGTDMTYLGAVPGAQILVYVGLTFFACLAPTRLTSLRLNFVLLAMAMIGLPSLRGAVWDYYGVEIALVGALCVTSSATTSIRFPRVLANGLAIYAVACLIYAGSLWRFHDLIALKTRLYEEAQRRGAITLHEVSRAPFGYTGWKLFDAMVKLQKDSQQFHGLAAFLCEINEQASLIESRPLPFATVQNCEGAPESSLRIVATVQGRILWKTETLDLLVPCSYDIPKQTMSQCLASGQLLETKIFPLNKQEWNQWIQEAGQKTGIPLLSLRYPLSLH